MSSKSRFQINVDHTINSGQVFLWRKENGFWYGIHGQDILKIDEKSAKVFSVRQKKYDLFRNADRFDIIYDSLCKDATLRHAVSEYQGLRILRQEPFQCMISFIVSSNSSIAKIKKSLLHLCRKFGRQVFFDDIEFFTFPSAKDIATAKTSELSKCGFGYRTLFVKNAARAVLDKKIDFDELKSMPYQDAKKSIMQLHGIGDKVADCILLFSLEKLEAFPLDRWMIRALQNHYSNKFSIETKTITSKQYELLHKKIVNYFGPYAGYAQQFLFKMERESNEKNWL